LLKSLEEIFGLPILPSVTTANDFADLFEPGFFPQGIRPQAASRN
jgi:hypothetical protein